jgi:PAS domain S-box-containing protein
MENRKSVDPNSGQSDLFAGESEMSRLMRSHDWSATPVGPVAGWPQSLKIAVRILLGSRYAMWLGWGRDLTFFYNDAYAHMTLGAKHPWALGRSAREVWAEIWKDIGPRAESVFSTGIATWDERLLLFLERQGFPEETYHTFSYSPVPDDKGTVGGMLCVVTEDTEQVIGERRLKTLRELAARTTEEAKSAKEACEIAARMLAGNPQDLPFALMYLLDPDSKAARLAGATGLPFNSPAAPKFIDLTLPHIEQNAWPIGRVIETGNAEVVTDFRTRLGNSPVGVYREPPHTAAVLPVKRSGQERLAGFLVAGISPRRPFDDAYRGFFDLLAGQVATAVANASAYEEERQRAEALAELDRAKTTFFSNVSHEFRTPLTLMLGPVEDALARHAEGQLSVNRETLSVVHRNGLRLQKLVNTLLDFSRIEAGRVQASFEPTDLARFTAELASNFRSACQRAGLELVVDCPPLAEPVYVDRDMWEKVVLNLLSNAFKFTLKGRIEVSLRQKGTAVQLAVRDTGIGIPEGQIPRLFERFHRVDGSKGRTQEGSGIGLALVRELVRLHGGDVRAESRLDVGTTFRVSLPLGSVHLPSERIRTPVANNSNAHNSSAFLEEALRWLPDAASPERVEPGPSDSGIFESPLRHSNSEDRPRILLVDDNADMRDYVKRLLSGHYEVTALADGLAARDEAFRRAPDLVLTDVMMPGLDGFGLIKELRSDPRTASVPVLLLSARAGEESRVEGLQSGADDYLIKPFSTRELLARVQAHLSLAKVRREANEVLQRSESFHRLITDLTSDFTFAIRFENEGASSVVEFVSPGFTTVTGYTLDELNARGGWPTIIYPEDMPTVTQTIERMLANQQDVSEARLIATDGSLRWVRYLTRSTLNASGQVTGFIGAAQEITDRKQASEALREASATLRSFYDSAPVMMGIVDVSDDDILHITDNAATGRFFGVNHAALANKRASELGVKKEYLKEWIRHYHESRRTGQPVRFEYPHDTSDGIRWLSAIVYCIDGRPDGTSRCSYVAEDITERKRTEEALREAERSWRSLAEALPNLVWTDLPDGRCDYLSSQWGVYTGIPEKELLGLNWLDRVIHPDDRERTLACWMNAVADKGDYDLEYRIRRHDGEYHWFKTRGVPIRDDNGRIVKWFGTCTDIEDQKRAVEELRQSEERFRQLADAMPQIVWTAGTDGIVDYSNQRWYEFSGLSAGTGNENWSVIVHPDDLPAASVLWTECVRDGTAFESELRLYDRRTDGYLWHLIRTEPVRNAAGIVHRWYGTATNIDAQKRAGDASRFLAEASAELATLVDYESTLQKVTNLAVPYFADWSSADVVTESGAVRRLAMTHQNPEKVRLAQELVRKYPPNPNTDGGTSRVFRTGKSEMRSGITDEMLVRSAKDEEHLRLLRSLGLRSYICVPLIVSGETLGTLTFATAESGRDFNQSDLALAEDLTHRAAIAIENAKLYRELREADRRKDEFLATLAHELRNPLAPIRTSLQILRMPMLDAATAERSREMMERQVHHLVRLVDDLLDVSRVMRGKIELRKERVELATIIARAVETAQPVIEGQGHELTIDLASESLPLEADPVRLAQVIGNLLNNSAKYTERRGRIRVTARREGNQAVLRIRDNGIGIATDMLPKIFDLFVQVENVAARSQGGLGIGLTLVRNLVEMHNGRVEATSPGLGKGSEFIVRLPLAPTTGMVQEPPSVQPRAQGSTGLRLLVVDDNQDAADSLAMLLRLQNHEVRVVHNGLAALELARDYRPELVFLDIGMPGMDGYEVARRLRQQSGLENVFLAAVSGWGQVEDRRRSAEAGFDHHLVKPVEPKVLDELLAGLTKPTKMQ